MIRRPTPALSDLSATEFLTLARMGYVPHGLVLGAAVYDAGWRSTMAFGTTELTSVSQAMRASRHLALERMRKQAEAVGAEGVVGVRLQVEHHAWHGGHNVARFLAVGTAIGFDRNIAPPELENASSLRVGGRPFTSDLSGQDFVLLLRAGYRPVSVAMGSCVYHLGMQVGLALSGNSEIAAYTQAFMNARETAMENMIQDLAKEIPQGPDYPVGVVGMTVEEIAHAGSRNVIEFSAVGTAVTPLERSDPRRAPKLPEPVVVVPVNV
jgi:uncharacterized protein YbjQ (UPF0145 family)